MIRKARWLTGPDVPWLSPGDVPADALLDLRTEANALSVCQVEADLSNLERVVAALAASRDTLANADFVLFDVRILTSLAIGSEATCGATPDEEANARWHLDLVELTAARI